MAISRCDLSHLVRTSASGTGRLIMKLQLLIWVGVFAVAGSAITGSAVAAPELDPLKASPSDLIRALGDAFLLAEEYSVYFDAEIAKGKTLEDLSSEGHGQVYAKLLAVRELKERYEAELQKRIDLETVGGVNEASRSAVKVLRREIKKLVEVGEFDSTVLEFALVDGMNYAKQHDDAKPLPGSGFESALIPPKVENLREWRSRFRQEGAVARGSSILRVFRKWVGTRAPVLGTSIHGNAAPALESGPGDLKIFPSATQAGNITGNGFEKGTWALTFDDGPGVTTDEVIGNLKTHGIQASFFALSGQFKKSSLFRSYALKELADGHDVFSHSFDHLQISKLGPADRRYQIEDAIEALAEVTGARTRYFRLPYGAGVSVPAVRQDLVKSCVVHIFWNVDTLDWHDHDPDLIESRTLAQMKSLGRGIILFHDIHAQSVIASERIMKHLKAEGLKTVKISDYVSAANGGKEWSCTVAWPKK
ncbi:MAG: hypothetical protein EBX52_04975 [Proteobacteria bacterium]|nr:hypothetical protein [Pseudomonadota bacterium]